MIVPFVSFISKEFERVNFEFSHHVTKRNLFFWVSKVSEYWKEYKFSIRKKEKETMSNPWNHLTEFRSSKKTQQPRTIPLSSFRAPFPPITTLFQRRINRRNDFSGSRRAPVCQITRLNVPDLCVHFTTAIRAAVNHDKQGTVGAPPRGRQRDNEASLLSAASQTLRPALIASIIIPWNG